MMKRSCLLALIGVGALAPGSADSWTPLETIGNAERELGAATAAVSDFKRKAKAGEDVAEELAAARITTPQRNAYVESHHQRYELR